MKLPGFFQRSSRRSEASGNEVADADMESDHPGNAAEERMSSSDETSKKTSVQEGSQEHSPETTLPVKDKITAKSGTEDSSTSKTDPNVGISSKASEQREPDDIESLWFSLVDNPNNEKNLNRLIAYCQTRKGPSAVHAALGELAMEENSYLPRLVMAARSLERKEIDEALSQYKMLLSQGVPNDYSLLRISADLGRNGHPAEMIQIIRSVYDPQKHNEYVGLNLLQACKESGKIADGCEIWQQLRELDRPKIAAALETFSDMFAPKNCSSPDPTLSEGSVDSTESTDRESTDIPKHMSKDNQASSDITAEERNARATIDKHGRRENIENEETGAEKRLRIITVPVWKLWIPVLRDILPDPDSKERVGIYLYSDVSSTPTEEGQTSSRSVAAGLPLLIGEKLLFSSPSVPVVLFPISFSKGPDFGASEPDVAGLFALCAKESLNYLIAGTIAFEGERRTIRTWILDRAQNTARVLSQDSSVTEFGDAARKHIDEIIEPFSDKNYTFEAKRRGFSYSAPNPATIEAHMDALMRLGLRLLVDSGFCSADVLCPQKELLDRLAELCRAKPFSQNYLMMLLGGMISDRENGGEAFIEYRELLFETAQKLQYTPCVTTARESLDKVLSK
ncbi:MAG: hypothetical protein JW780_05910 [Clostridiales bacterium]|nr:hypothetical protein [Clostridiales bacterium]